MVLIVIHFVQCIDFFGEFNEFEWESTVAGGRKENAIVFVLGF